MNSAVQHKRKKTPQRRQTTLNMQKYQNHQSKELRCTLFVKVKVNIRSSHAGKLLHLKRGGVFLCLTQADRHNRSYCSM